MNGEDHQKAENHQEARTRTAGTMQPRAPSTEDAQLNRECSVRAKTKALCERGWSASSVGCRSRETRSSSNRPFQHNRRPIVLIITATREEPRGALSPGAINAPIPRMLRLNEKDLRDFREDLDKQTSTLSAKTSKTKSRAAEFGIRAKRPKGYYKRR